MIFSIITPSFGQLDWLRLCIASVADQVIGENAERLKNLKANIREPKEELVDHCSEVGTPEAGSGNLEEVEEEKSEVKGQRSGNIHTHPYQNLASISQLPASAQSSLTIEHIIQDGGSPGIEEFAREIGVYLCEKYGGEAMENLSTFELLHLRTESGYSLRVFKEQDAGMYDAINKGIARMSGDLWAWLNSDEQYLPGTLHYVAGWFEEHPQTEILCGDALLTDGEGRAISYRRILRPTWHHTRLVHLASLSCTSFYRRSVVIAGGIFNTGWRSIGDAEWMARVLKSGCSIGTCGKPLATFAFTGQNTSESPLASQEGERWRKAADAPPEWMSKPTIWLHRLRKLLGGAYQIRTVEYAIHQKGVTGRVVRSAAQVGWKWPIVGDQVVGEKADKLKSLKAKIRELGEEIEVAEQSAIISLLGSSLAVTTYSELSNKLIEYVDKREGVLAVDFANTHVITLRRHDSKFATLTKCMDVIVPDGMPLVWVMNAKGAGLKDRVYGPTFTRKFLESCPAGLTHYLVGGSEECGQKFRKRMLALNPTLNFVGGYHGMSSTDGVLEDDEAVLEEIREKKPDFIWVGLGTPKQYAWIHRIKPQLDHGVLLAVGFAFDVNAGMKQDTPEWMQRLGLGWLHRMLSEPKRLIGRYLKWNSLFLWYLLAEGSKIRFSRGKGQIIVL